MATREGIRRIGLVLLVLCWLFVVLLLFGSLAWLLFTTWDAWHKRGETDSFKNFFVYGCIPAGIGVGISSLLTWILDGFGQEGGK